MVTVESAQNWLELECFGILSSDYHVTVTAKCQWTWRVLEDEDERMSTIKEL